MEINNKVLQNLPMEIINHILSYRPTHEILTNTCHDYSTEYEHNSFLEDITEFNREYLPNCDLPFYKFILDRNDCDTTHKIWRCIMIDHFKKNNVKNLKVVNYYCNCGFEASQDERYYKYRILDSEYIINNV
jgi:hypothetical protein